MSPALNVLLLPIGSSGDVNPFVGLGAALKKRGHRVTVATNPYFEALIRRESLEFEPLGKREEFTSLLNHPDLWHPRRCFEFVARQVASRSIRPVYKVVEKHNLPGKTVVVAPCLGLGARVAQDKLGVPLVSAHLQPAVFQSETDPFTLPVLDAWARRSRGFLRLLYRLGNWRLDRVILPELNALRKELGLAPLRHIIPWWHSPQRIIGFFPDWFGAPQPDWPPQARVVGFPLYDGFEEGAHASEVENFLRHGPPPVVFAPGSANAQAGVFLRESVRACEELGERGILLTRFPEQVPALPPSVRAFRYVPLSRLLPRSKAVVHHGGIGTTAQALAAGVPQLISPLAHDQPDNARRAQGLGVARIISPRRYKAHAAASLLAELLKSPDVQANCRAVAGRFPVVRPFEAACELIENLV